MSLPSLAMRAYSTFAQANAQVHGGFPFSGLMTPFGTNSQAYVESNMGPLSVNYASTNAEYWYVANGWLYSPTGYSQVSLTVSWYDRSQGYIGSSSNFGSLAAGVWTNVVNYYAAPPTACYATVLAFEIGTPPATATLYLSNVALTAAPEVTGALASVAAVNYPPGAPWPPTGVTQLA